MPFPPARVGPVKKPEAEAARPLQWRLLPKASGTRASSNSEADGNRPPRRKRCRCRCPILLEGDKPSAPAVAGPGQRYALGPTPPAEHGGGAEESGERSTGGLWHAAIVPLAASNT